MGAVTKRERIEALERRIAELEARLRAVEARPVYVPTVQPQPRPPWRPGVGPYGRHPYVTGTDSAPPLNGTVSF